MMENLRKPTCSRKLLARISILACVVFSTNVISPVSGYKGGASPSVCDTMIPAHGAQPQTGPNPYKVVLSKSSVKGQETIDITLTSNSGNEEFHGFLIQVRKPGVENKAFGEFKDFVPAGNARVLQCFDIPKSAMTHVSPEPKKTVTVQWTAPNNEDGEYQVFFSVVGTQFDIFWTHVPHEEKIRVTRDAEATTAAPIVVAASPELLEQWRKVYTGCGVTKGCFGMPGKCVEEYDPESVEPTTCAMMVTWEKKGTANQYQLTGRPGSSQNGHVSVGFSSDTQMGTDSVAGCAFRGSGNGPVVERYVNPGQSNIKHSKPKHGIEAQTTSAIIDGNYFCDFEQTNHEIDGLNVNLDDSNYYLLLAKAPSVSDGGLGQHPSNDDKGVSPQAVHITDNIILGADSNTWLVQLHGGLMVIAWLMCASTGMFTARYYKLTHTDFMPCGKAFWFSLHVFCMAATAFLTIAGAIIIIIKKKGFVLRDAHPILGVIVNSLAVLQVIIGLLRPHPGTTYRPLFNWVHWGVGNSAHITGIACIFLAEGLGLAELKRFSDDHLWTWIMMGIVLFHVLMHIVMSIHTLWADKQMNSSNKKRAVVPGPMKPNGLSTEAPGTAFRTFMLSLYLLVMAGGAIALVALIFWPKNKDASTS